MMTSRCEYRLLLRQDNADRRLVEYGRRVGLIDDERYAEKIAKFQAIDDEIERAENTYFSPTSELNDLLISLGSQPVSCGVKLADLLRRPGIGYEALASVDTRRPELSEEVLKEAEIEIKYAGYIKRQKAQAEQFRKLEAKPLPKDLDYNAITGLRLEARQKLSQIRPESIGQASRISGVSPADISVLLIYLNMSER
jgi:tRNA uridine 5-carboxymethylaminomethyl modification enzyme